MKTKPEFIAKARKSGIPAHTINGLVSWVYDGNMPGGFLQAVLDNNLIEALGRADSENIVALDAIARFVYNWCPMDCHSLKSGLKREFAGWKGMMECGVPK